MMNEGEGEYHLEGRLVDGLLRWWARVVGFEVSFQVLGLLERRLELAWENSNRQDLIRFGKFLSPGYLRPNASPSHLLLFPIPEAAWETNNKLVQNPGYPAF